MRMPGAGFERESDGVLGVCADGTRAAAPVRERPAGG